MTATLRAVARKINTRGEHRAYLYVGGTVRSCGHSHPSFTEARACAELLIASEHHLSVECAPGRGKSTVRARWSCSCGARGPSAWTTPETAHAEADLHRANAYTKGTP